MSYFARYTNGEYETVWEEMFYEASEKGARRTFQEDVFAVACETMKRVRVNLEMLIQRLSEEGYTFGYDWAETLIESERQRIEEYKRPGYLAELGIPEDAWQDMLIPEVPQWIEDQPSTIIDPLGDIESRITMIEQQKGFLPISLKAWYEVVGSVNFVGIPPLAWISDNHIRRFASRLDPLRIDPFIDKHFDSCLQQGIVHISPDEHEKYYSSGGGIYSTKTRQSVGVDFVLEGCWLQIRFVDYLRLAISWGGFPGMGRIAHRPHQDITFLTNDLLLF